MRLFIIALLVLLGQVSTAKENLSKEDTAIINAKIRSIIPLIKTDRDSALKLNIEVYNKCVTRGYEQGIADAGWILGTYEMKQSHHEKARRYYEQSINYYLRQAQNNKLVNVMILVGVNEGMQGNSAKALGWFLKAAGKADQLKDDHLKADINYKIGLVYGQVNDFSNAINYTEQSLKYAKQTNDKEMQATVYNNLGTLYGQRKQYKEALQILNKGRRIASDLKTPVMLPDLFLNMGIAYREASNYSMSKAYLDSALLIYNEIPFPAKIASTTNAMANLLVRQKKYDEAMSFLSTSMRYASEIDDKSLLCENNILMHEIYTAKGLYKQAAGLFDTITSLQKIADNADERASVEKVGMAIEVQRVRDEVKAMQAEQVAKNQKLNLLSALTILSIVFVIVCVAGFVHIQKKNKQLEFQKAELAQANKQKDKVFAIISHDLRSPLNSILGSLEIMESSDLPEDVRIDLLKSLQLSVSATSETLDNLLKWGSGNLRKEALHAEAVDVNKLTEQTTQLLTNVAAHKSIRLIRKLDDICIARFDKGQLAFIMRNLMVNAIKFSNQGQDIEICGRKEKDRIILAVKDNGIGMSEEVRMKLFASHEVISERGTAGERGVGLGLMLIHEFLEKNKGKMTVTSQEGKGSCFELNIPAV